MSHPLALPLVLCLGFFDDVDAMDQLKGDRFMNLQSDLSQLNDNDTTAKMAASQKHFMSYLQSLRSIPKTEDAPSAEVLAVPSSCDRLLDMAWLVNDLEFTTTAMKVFSTFSLEKLHSDLKVVFKNLVSGTGTGSKEKALVADILQTFRKRSDSSLLFKSEGNVILPDPTDEKPTICRYDLLVAQQEPMGTQREHDRYTSSCTPVLFVEFGLGNLMWWKKLDQAYNYVNWMTSPDNVGPINEESLEIEYMPVFDKAMLMSAITIDKDTGAFRIALFLCWRRQNEPTKAAKKIKVSEIPVDGFDMILLWRSMWINGPTQNQGEDDESEDNKSEDKESDDIDSENIDHPGSNEFAMALVAIFVAMQCLKDWQKKECSDNFLVLGPNCCKVKLVQVR